MLKLIAKKSNKSIKKGKGKTKHLWKLHLKKFTKTQKGNFLNFFKIPNKLLYGYFGVKSLDSGVLYKFHLEIFSKYLKKFFKKFCFKFWLRFHLFFPLTKKSLKSRMGKGKGEIKDLISKIPTGKIILELVWKINSIHLERIWKNLILLLNKFPFKVKIFWNPIHFLTSDLTSNKFLYGF
jgi:ribosomal protein L16/L10AE